MQTMAPYQFYTNNATAPGTIAPFWIERLLVDPAGYVSCLTTNGLNSAMGYIDLSGSVYTQNVCIF